MALNSTTTVTPIRLGTRVSIHTSTRTYTYTHGRTHTYTPTHLHPQLIAALVSFTALFGIAIWALVDATIALNSTTPAANDVSANIVLVFGCVGILFDCFALTAYFFPHVFDKIGLGTPEDNTSGNSGEGEMEDQMGDVDMLEGNVVTVDINTGAVAGSEKDPVKESLSLPHTTTTNSGAAATVQHLPVVRAHTSAGVVGGGGDIAPPHTQNHSSSPQPLRHHSEHHHQYQHQHHGHALARNSVVMAAIPVAAPRPSLVPHDSFMGTTGRASEGAIQYGHNGPRASLAGQVPGADECSSSTSSIETVDVKGYVALFFVSTMAERGGNREVVVQVREGGCVSDAGSFFTISSVSALT